MGVGAGFYMCDVVKKSSRSLSHLLMSSCQIMTFKAEMRSIAFHFKHRELDVPNRLTSYRVLFWRMAHHQAVSWVAHLFACRRREIRLECSKCNHCATPTTDVSHACVTLGGSLQQPNFKHCFDSTRAVCRGRSPPVSLPARMGVTKGV